VPLVNGAAVITAADVDGGSFASCGIKSLTISRNSFDCSSIGDNKVELTITDVFGNTSTCTAVVTVKGEIPTCSIKAIPSSKVFTGGIPTNLYLGYGPQSDTLAVQATGGSSFTYAWSPAAGLDNPSSARPVFTPTAPGVYTFTVVVTNNYGCVTRCSITITVTDVRCGKKKDKIIICHMSRGDGGDERDDDEDEDEYKNKPEYRYSTYSDYRSNDGDDKKGDDKKDDKKKTRYRTECISKKAVAKHLAHGDKLGPCPVPPKSESARGRDITSNENVINNTFRIYPNPVTTIMNVELGKSAGVSFEISVTDMQGRLLINRKTANNRLYKMDVSSLRSGIYMIQLKSAGKLIGTTRFTISK
jgi:hypothetical protein